MAYQIALHIRRIRKREMAAYMAKAYRHASTMLQAHLPLQKAIERVKAFGTGLVVTDLVGSILGGVLIVAETPERPRLCWAWLRWDLQSAGLARDIAALLIAAYFAQDPVPAVSFQALTSSHHVLAHRALEGFGFVPTQYATLLTTTGTLVQEHQWQDWRLTEMHLTKALEHSLKVPAVSVRPLGAGLGFATIMVFHDVVLRAGLRAELEAEIRRRRMDPK